MIKGSIVALVTPMLADDGVDWDSLASLIEFHIENQTQGIVSVGTTGESATLDHDEHCDVIRFTIDKVAGRIPVIAGTGANSTSEAIKLTACARDLGADSALLVTPYYNKPTQEGLYQHYKKIAEEVDIPQILYNVPGRTACDLLPATVARLARIPNIIAIKEATGKVERVAEIKKTCPADFLLLSGDDSSCTEFMLQGGDGVISVTTNVVPRQMRAMCDAALSGDHALAQSLNQPLASLHRDLFVESNPIPVKWALAEMKLIKASLRLPLTVLSSQYHEVLRLALRQANIM